MFKQLIDFVSHRFQHLNTRQKILAGFSVPLILMLVIAVTVYQSIQQSNETAAWVKHTQEVIAAGHELNKLMIDMETGERGFLITGKDEFLVPFIDAKEVWGDKVDEYKSLVTDNLEQVSRLDKIDQLQQQWQHLAAEVEIAKRRSVPESDKSLTYMQNVLRKKMQTGYVTSRRY